MIRRWLTRRLVAWERRHPEEARELAIRVLEKQLGRPLDEASKHLIRTVPIDYDKDER